MNKPLRILLVDNYEIYRQGLQHFLEAEDDMEVIGESANAEEALTKMARLHPNIVLMDAQMSVMSGGELMRSVKRSGLDYGCAVIIMGESLDNQDEALKAGAVGYLHKGMTPAEVVQAVREAYQDWRLQEESHRLVEQAVDLIILPPADRAQLLRFVYHLEKRLGETHGHFVVTHMVGSWDGSAVIRILAPPEELTNLLERLETMPEVEKVEEEPLAGDTLSGLP